MVKPSTPLQSLLLLLLAGLAMAGWLYGIHWKRIASGDLFSSDEKLMIRLQDQIQFLTVENEKLNDLIKSMTGDDAAPDPAPSVPVDPSPMLPAFPRKIETH